MSYLFIAPFFLGTRELLLIILILAIYTLPIILFVKIWRMTNHVKALKKKYVDENEIAQVRVAFMKGNKAQAKDLLDSAFYSEILRLSKENQKKFSYNKIYPQIVRRYERLYRRMELPLPDFNLYYDRNNLP